MKCDGKRDQQDGGRERKTRTDGRHNKEGKRKLELTITVSKNAASGRNWRWQLRLNSMKIITTEYADSWPDVRTQATENPFKDRCLSHRKQTTGQLRLKLFNRITLVMKTLVMLSGLSPSGLGGPRSCSPSPFSKLCRKAGLRMCWSTFEKGPTQFRENNSSSKCRERVYDVYSALQSAQSTVVNLRYNV